MKLNTKFLILLVIIPIFLLGAVSTISFIQQKKYSVNDEIKIQKAIAISTANTLHGELNEKKQILQDISRLESTKRMLLELSKLKTKSDFLNSKIYLEFVENMRGFAQEDDVSMVYIGDPKSKTAIADHWIELPDNYNATIRPWYKLAKENDRFSLTDPYINYGDGKDHPKIAISASMPVKDDNNKFIGVAALDIEMWQFYDAVNEIVKQYNYTISIVSTTGSLIFSSLIDSKTLNSSIIDLNDYFIKTVHTSNIGIIHNIINNINKNENGFVILPISQNDKEFNEYVTYQIIPETNWIVLISSLESNVIQSAVHTVAQSILFMVISFLSLSIVLFLFIQIKIVKQIKLTTNNIKDISEGEGDLTSTLQVTSKDEIGSLAKNFNKFVNNLKNIIVSIKQSTNKINKTQIALEQTSEKTNKTSQEITINTDTIINEIKKLDTNITDNVSVFEQISANMSNINKQIDNQAAMVEESTAAITEMMSSLENTSVITAKKAESINNLVNIIQTGNKALNDMVNEFKENVVNKIDGISEMAQTIQSISSQTNLLSMNAAIEAAHAGDAGRGFAVVADEIRKLAETAAKSSASISNIIKEISDGVSETEIKANQSSQAFIKINEEVKGTKKAFEEIAASTNELTAGGSQVLKAITTLQNTTINIKNASSEIVTGIEQAVKLQHETKDISNQVTQGMRNIESNINSINDISNELNNNSEQLKNIINELLKQVNKFKTD